MVKNLYILLLLSGLINLVFTNLVFAQSVEILQQGQPCSIRGLSVVDNRTAWASGSKGHVAITRNGGKSWSWQQIKGFEQSDFRDVEAFSDQEAIVISSGTPALILKTTDGGTIWKLVYRNDNPAYFLDAMDFFNLNHGLIMGDPINGRFLLLETNNKGESWKELKIAPQALPGESAFAASGTCLRISKNQSSAVLVSGGAVSRYFVGNQLQNWKATALPLAQGKASKGAFSIVSGGGYTVIVGGDYQKNNNIDSVTCYRVDKNNTNSFQLAQRMPAGYQSCVAYIKKITFVSTGTSGTNITFDGGKTWKQINTDSFNVCAKARHGNLVLLAGDGGKLACFKNQ
ncbi:MAG: oxidoreductase [Sphingobacteriaceae bacterium]|nr:MAG: oxidoreductase [Sphingobacteriaceae bacterium]